MSENFKIELGKCLIVNIAPGWIYAGRVVRATKDELTLSPAVYVETLSAAWPEAATDRKKITKSSTAPWITARMSAILWYASAAESVVGKDQLAAIEGAK